MKPAIFILFLLSFLSLTFFPLASISAQIGTTQADINISMIPENPGPNETVHVSLTSYVTDINSATITWTINGKTIQSGKGIKSFSFTTGVDGTTTTLGVTILTKEGETIRNTIPIKPVSVDLLWQSESYTPPFYKGKALWSYQNKITFIALPHLVSGSGEISPKNLIYTWKKNGSVMDTESGYGKNTLTVTSSIIARALDISVEVTSATGSAHGFAQLSIAPGDPMVLFYKKSPVYGIEFQKTLFGTVEMTDSKEISVVAVPFFFATNDPQKGVTYEWTINGKIIDDDTSQTTRIFRQVEGVSGTANIGVAVKSLTKVLQLAKGSFNLTFGEPTVETPSF